MQTGVYSSGAGSAAKGIHKWKTPQPMRKIRRTKKKKIKKPKPTEGVSNLHCTCAGNSLLVIKEMCLCCACPPDTPREHSSLKNQGTAGITKDTQPRFLHPAHLSSETSQGWACRHLSRAHRGTAGHARQGGGYKQGEAAVVPSAPSMAQGQPALSYHHQG